MHASQSLTKQIPPTVTQICHRLRVIACEIGGDAVEVDQPGPDRLWAARILFEFDRSPLTGKGRTPQEALTCLVERRAAFERGFEWNSLDILGFPIADFGLRRAIEVTTSGRRDRQKFSVVWPTSDDALVRHSYLASFGEPIVEDDVSPDAYGLPWYHWDGYRPTNAVTAFANRLRLLGYSLTRKPLEEPFL